MKIRSLSLEEWFLYYQQQHIDQGHGHIDGMVEADLSPLRAAYGKDLPLTPLLVKAMGLTLKHVPEVNRQFVHSLLGPRMIEGSGCHVNVPVLLNFDGQDYLSVTTIQDADRMPLAEIQAQIRAYRKTPLAQLPIGKYIVGQPNTLFTRTRLRLIHSLVSALPQIQVKMGAGLASVSSLMNLKHEGTQVCLSARGPGGLSLTAAHFDAASHQLRLGVSWDHYVCKGYRGVEACLTLTRILQGELDRELLLT